MELTQTKKFIKQLREVQFQKPKQVRDTEIVIEVMRLSSDFMELVKWNESKKAGELSKMLPNYGGIKKMDVDDSYVIAYSNKPEMRIRFCKNKGKVESLTLREIGTHEEYNRNAHKPLDPPCGMELNEGEGCDSLKILVTEEQYNRIFLNKQVKLD